ncbi:hypothetical protein ES332_A06G197700v1 [Gossypium tomentosum]|uniref:Uncharacterized protein n=1 Tax=Gossypium tomentosum TaxID=34277 RepID=A0A5D2Q6V1_GOSTO|nr:hypothetical protein ES332_A06G197700v1 [Gossypium tomentosum]
MEVESGESSSRKRKWERPPVLPLTLATLQAVKERAEKRGNRISLGVIVKYFDNIDAPYEWLLPGWIVEERFVLFDYKGCVRIYEVYQTRIVSSILYTCMQLLRLQELRHV